MRRNGIVRVMIELIQQAIPVCQLGTPVRLEVRLQRHCHAQAELEPLRQHHPNQALPVLKQLGPLWPWGYCAASAAPAPPPPARVMDSGR